MGETTDGNSFGIRSLYKDILLNMMYYSILSEKILLQIIRSRETQTTHLTAILDVC